MVQAAGPAPVYVRVRQKTNRKKGVLPPAWSPTFRPTRTGAPVSRTLPRAAAPRPCLLPLGHNQEYAWCRNRSMRPVTPSPGEHLRPNAPGTEGPCAIELRSHALRKRIESLEKAPRRDKVKRQEALKSLRRYKREYNRCLDLLEGCEVAEAEFLPDEPRPGTPYTVGRTTHVRPGCASPLSDSSTVSVWSTSPRKLSSRGTFPFSNTEDRRLASPTVVSPKTFANLFAH